MGCFFLLCLPKKVHKIGLLYPIGVRVEVVYTKIFFIRTQITEHSPSNWKCMCIFLLFVLVDSRKIQVEKGSTVWLCNRDRYVNNGFSSAGKIRKGSLCYLLCSHTNLKHRTQSNKTDSFPFLFIQSNS